MDGAGVEATVKMRQARSLMKEAYISLNTQSMQAYAEKYNFLGNTLNDKAREILPLMRSLDESLESFEAKMKQVEIYMGRRWLTTL